MNRTPLQYFDDLMLTHSFQSRSGAQVFRGPRPLRGLGDTGNPRPNLGNRNHSDLDSQFPYLITRTEIYPPIRIRKQMILSRDGMTILTRVK
ncbi:MAG: hypothetical protein Ct9H90mP14_2060 [Methanobacteriota archaeon]|nr:MAG: hypothetical protein Ct9H90mP14_2060 [Euryarchaeota archaeon]